jgi:phenylpropionate dioxygenase-like ring-hydroxylating dioxygenase large terminal subunit
MTIDATSRQVLPAQWYSDPSVFEIEQRRIFGHSWQLAGSAAQVAEPGDCLPFRAGELPLLVTRDDAGALNGMVNVCRHRGSEIVREPGRHKRLQCPYHGWTYGLDGCLRAAPRSRENPDFSVDRHRLPRAQAAEWSSMLFVNPDSDAPPLAGLLGELGTILDATSVPWSAMGTPIRREWEIQANWKILVENYLECYHCPLVHPSFSGVIDMDDFSWRESEHFIIQGGPIRDGSGATGSDLFTAYIWPNTFLNTYPGPANVTTQVIVPVAPDRSVLIYDYYFLEEVEEATQREFLEFWDIVQQEDVPLCESVHRGLASGSLPEPNLMLPREDLLGWLHGRVRGAIGDEFTS